MRSLIKFLGSFLLMFLAAGMIACGGGGGTTPAAAVVSVTGVSVSPATTTILTGRTVQLSALVSPSGATNKTVTWTIDDEAIATVDSSSGLVTADANNTGTATITATTADGSFTDTCVVTVTATEKNVTGISVTPDTKSINVGVQFTAEVEFTPSDTTDTGINWSTSNSSVATVSNGIVTGVAAGTATITATSTYSGTITDTCVVTVSDPGVSGTYNVTLDFGEESDTDTWVLQQSGNNVTLVYGDVPDGDITVSGSYLVFNWAWTEEEDGEEISYTLTGSLPISGDTIAGTLTLAYGTDSSSVSVTMTRTSTSIEIPVFEIPAASEDITVDGTVTDWAGVSTFITDTTGDSDVTGCDIKTIKLARDGTKVYGLVHFDAAFPIDYQFDLGFTDISEHEISIGISHDTNGSWNINGGTKDNNSYTPITGFTGSVSANEDYIEFSFVYSGVIDLDTNYFGEARIFPNTAGGDSLDDAELFGYTVLPTLDK